MGQSCKIASPRFLSVKEAKESHLNQWHAAFRFFVRYFATNLAAVPFNDM
jgi:hypothetical protein